MTFQRHNPLFQARGVKSFLAFFRGNTFRAQVFVVGVKSKLHTRTKFLTS